MKAWQYVTKGWCQGDSMQDATGKITCIPSKARFWCAVGALNAAYPRSWQFKLDLLRDSIPTEYPDVARWNDAACRTKQEVVALLKRLDL